MRSLSEQRRTLRRAVVLGVIATLVALGPSVVAAGEGRFTDVSAGHPFSAEIERVAEAGVAAGFPDGTFRPSEPVTRQAMAAFLTRAGSAGAMTEDTVVSFPALPFGGQPAELQELTVDVPGSPGTHQLLQVMGSVVLDAAGLGCPCEGLLRVRNVTTGEVAFFSNYELALGAGNDVDETLWSMWQFEAPAGPNRLVLEGRVSQATSGSPSLSIDDAVLTAFTIPFSAIDGAGQQLGS